MVAADAVRLVDHEVARVEVGEGGDGRAPLEDGTAQPPPARAEDVLLGEQDEPEGGQLEARRAIARDDTEALRAPEGGVGPRLQIVLLEDAAAARGLRLVVHDQTHGESFPSPAPDLRREVLEAALEAAHRARAHGDPRHTPTSALKERQLEPLEAIERLGERHGGGRLLRWRLEERGVVEDDQRLPGQPRGQGVIGVGSRQGEHRQLAERLHGSLRGRIEEPERFDLVPEELRARGPIVGRREDVDDSAPQAPLSHLDHGLHPLVAGRLERPEKSVPFQARSHRQREGPRAKGLRGENRRTEGGGRGDHHDGAPGHEGMADQGPLGDMVAMAPMPGAGLGGGKLQNGDLRGVERVPEEADVLGGAVTLGGARGEIEDGPAGVADSGDQIR